MDLGDLLWGMFAFFFWTMIIWMFFVVFGDIFRRDDMSGWAKAGWTLLIFVLPFLGVLIYVIARPKTARVAGGVAFGNPEQAQRHSAADDIAKLVELREAGDITAAEYESMKRQALASRS
jgi:uncharacterized membrane protein